MLVEIQLVHTQGIKETIDRAWGVQHNKNKKREAPAEKEYSGPSQENLMTIPIAQDASRLRYWSFDGASRQLYRRHGTLVLTVRHGLIFWCFAF
jgi:hypothetical protein